jgi:hypothetical protein
VGRLTIPQVMNLLLPQHQHMIDSVQPVRTPLSPGMSSVKEALKSGAKGITSRIEQMKVVHKLRYNLFDKVCDELHKSPQDLTKMFVDDVAAALSKVSGLPINKFPPQKVQQRIAEYVKSKKRNG